MLPLISAVLSTAIGALGTISVLIFLLVGSANSSAETYAGLKRWMLIAGVIGLSAMVGAAFAMFHGRHLLAAGIGGAPALVVAALILWLAIAQVR